METEGKSEGESREGVSVDGPCGKEKRLRQKNTRSMVLIRVS